ncbi:MAG: hypothetical protein L6R00_14100 [Phycisphaerae bacterium]|nr:hypothetical protein [Phycisphaerae bacterium]
MIDRRNSAASPHRHAGADRACFAGSFIVAALSSAALAEPFLPASLDAALLRGRDETRPVFVLVFDPHAAAANERSAAVWSHPALAALLRTRTVPIRLDAAANPDFVRRQRIDELPALLLLDADGRQRDRLIPYRLAADMLAELRAALDGRDVVDRARSAVAAQGEHDAFAREHLALALLWKRRFDESLAEFTWCIDVGLDEAVYAASRRDPLLRAARRLADDHPPAAALLSNRRDAWEKSLRAGDDDANRARNLAALHRALDESGRTLRLYDDLKPAGRARRVLRDALIEPLVAAKRYDDVATGGDLLELYRAQRRRLAAQPAACCAQQAGPSGDRGDAALEFAAMLIEAAAGARRDDDARRLIVAALADADAPAHRARLRAALTRANRSDLVGLVEKP